MKLFFKYMIPLAILPAYIVSCDKTATRPSQEGNEITFTVSLAGREESKAAGQFTGADINSLGTFNVSGYDGSDKVIDPREVARTNGVWKFNDNPAVWPQGHTMTFWAAANMPSWATHSSSASTASTFAVTSIPNNAADQWDPLVGYYSGTGTDGRADLVFYHPFTAVSFKTGSLGDPAAATGISSVKLDGVYKQGSAAVSSSSEGLSFVWTPTDTTNVTGVFSGTQSETPFLLIPQNMESAEIAITVTVSLVGGGTTRMHAYLESGEWKPGIHYTYTLDYSPYAQMVSNLKVTLEGWTDMTSTAGNDYFNANFPE